MKKNYNTITIKTFIVLLSMVTFELSAQLSGVVTINSGVATGGTNYQTFTALATALNTNGISGPLTVNVISATGPYTEQPSFNSITGTSATNTITVNGNGNLLTFASTTFGQGWVLGLGGADYMNFYDLNVSATGTYAYPCMLHSGADYNTFTACTFSVSTTGTSTNQIPVVLSGSGSSYATQANSGNYNSWIGCTMTGGAYGISMYANYQAPWNTGNKILNCTITNFYSRGIHHYFYHKNSVIKGNVIERPNRTSSTTTYGIYSYYNDGSLIEGNRIQRLFDSHLNSTSTTYGIYMYYNPAGGGKSNPNTIRNNIVSEIKHNGTTYGIAALYIDGYVYHNTISLDNAAATGGSTYGIYSYSQSGYEIIIKNNNISITRGGSGTKYGFYNAGITGNLTLDKNNYYVNAPAGTNYVGYYTGSANNLAAFQAQGVEPNGFSVDPVFTNPAALNFIPTAIAINNVGAPVGVYNDVSVNPRSGTNPDIGAHEFLSLNCSSTPSANAVSPLNFTVCPGEGTDLGLSNYYSDLGITYQWQSSTVSPVGPFTSVPGATTSAFTTPNITTSTWFGVVMTCTIGGGSVNPVGYVNVAGTTTSSVPYYESFEGITGPQKLPNCSWTSNSLGANCLTYTTTLNQNRSARTGTKFASFYGYYINGDNYFYTNGIQLNAGITYSASLWYKTEYYGYTNFTDLSIMLGASQSTTGLVTIASTNGPAVSMIYKSLSNTFTVASSGIYYVAVKATSDGNYGAYYLSWDDLEITIPCSLNSPTVSLSASAATICAGQSVNLTATGADTYSWSTGASGSVLTDMPQVNTTYMVTGISDLTGCPSMQSQLVIVNPAPVIMVYTNKPAVCAGQSSNITALGANSYTWSTFSNNTMITVTPNTTTTYSVSGSNQYNCSSMATQQIVVNPLPIVSIQSSAPTMMCAGETHTLIGGGAQTYQWAATTLFIQSAQAVISPVVTTTYSLTGIDQNGCSGKITHVQNVEACVGLSEITTQNGVKVYPNPSGGEFTIELNNSLGNTVEVTDLTGRVILSNVASEEIVKVNINHLANGIYYVKIQSENSVEVIKVVKQ